jgi:hypothetical protein
MEKKSDQIVLHDGYNNINNLVIIHFFYLRSREVSSSCLCNLAVIFHRVLQEIEDGNEVIIL